MTNKQKEKFLTENIYKGLTNLNTGWDAPTIAYFSETDFKTVLERIEKMSLGVYGIEPWDSDNHYFGLKLYDDYSSKPSDPSWYNKAFSEFIKTGEELQYSASYYVPEELLKK